MKDLKAKIKHVMADKHRKKIRKRVASGLIAVVVFCTTYALILPAITLEADTYCRKEAHTHSQDCHADVKYLCNPLANADFSYHSHTQECYLNGDVESALICNLDELTSSHAHDSSCKNGAGETICGKYAVTRHIHTSSCKMENAETGEISYSCTQDLLTDAPYDYILHAHDNHCYDSAGNLTCPLEETLVLSHTEDCCNSNGDLTCNDISHEQHKHTSVCYNKNGTFSCAMEDGGIHEHTASCYNGAGDLICAQPAIVNHIHTTDCENNETVLTTTCTPAEDAQADFVIHTHTNICYDGSNNLICTLSELSEHTHTQECYGDSSATSYDNGTSDNSVTLSGSEGTHALTCNKEAFGAHTHTDTCYVNGVLMCGNPQVIEHTHTDECIGVTTTPVTDDTRPKTLICTLEEHTHSDECYQEPESITYSFENDDVTMSVSLAWSGDLPADLSLGVTAVGQDDSSYDAMRDATDAAVETAEDESLDTIRFFRLNWTSGGEAYELPDGAKPEVSITLTDSMQDSEKTLVGLTFSSVILSESTEGAEVEGSQTDNADSENDGVMLMALADDDSEDTVSDTGEDTADTGDSSLTAQTTNSADGSSLVLTASSTNLVGLALTTQATSVTGATGYYKRLTKPEEFPYQRTSWINSEGNKYTNPLMIVSSNGEYAMYVPNGFDYNTSVTGGLNREKGASGLAVEVIPIKGSGNENYFYIRRASDGQLLEYDTTNSKHIDIDGNTVNTTLGYDQDELLRLFWKYVKRTDGLYYGTDDYGNVQAGIYGNFVSTAYTLDNTTWNSSRDSAGRLQICYSDANIANWTYRITLNKMEWEHGWRIMGSNQSGEPNPADDGASYGYVTVDPEVSGTDGYEDNVFRTTWNREGGDNVMLIYEWQPVTSENDLPDETDDIAESEELHEVAVATKPTRTYDDVSEQHYETTKITYNSDTTEAKAKSGKGSQNLEEEIGGNVTKTDAATNTSTDAKSKYENQAENDGRVITDKTIEYKDDPYNAFADNSYDNDEFSVTLSALAQEWDDSTTTKRSDPVDVVFLLDCSETMTKNNKWIDAIDSINIAMQSILSSDSDNRVGMVAYSNVGVEALPLGFASDFNTSNTNGQYFIYKTSSEDYPDAPWNTITSCEGKQLLNGVETYEGSATAYYKLWSRNNLQIGLQAAYEMFSSDTTHLTGEKRQPVIILVSGSTPTIASTNYTTPDEGPWYGDSDNYGVLSYYSVLSANYFKRMTGISYGQSARMYTIGVNVSGSDYDKAVLEPSAENLGKLSEDTSSQGYIYKYLLETDPDDESVSAVTYQVTNSNSVMHGGIGYVGMYMRAIGNPYAYTTTNTAGYNYCDKAFWVNADTEAMREALSSIVRSFTIVKYGFDLGGDDALTITDTISSYYEIDTTATGSGMALVVYGTVYTPSVTTGDGVTTYTWSGSVTRKVARPEDADANATPDSKKFNYDYFTVESEAEKLKLDDIKAVVKGNTVTWTIPETALTTFYPDLNQQFYYEEDPLRLVYQVGLTDTTLSGLSSLTTTTTYPVEDADTPVTATFTYATGNPYYTGKDGKLETQQVGNYKPLNSNIGNYDESVNESTAEVTQTLKGSGSLTIEVEYDWTFKKSYGDSATFQNTTFRLYRFVDLDKVADGAQDTYNTYGGWEMVNLSSTDPQYTFSLESAEDSEALSDMPSHIPSTDWASPDTPAMYIYVLVEIAPTSWEPSATIGSSSTVLQDQSKYDDLSDNLLYISAEGDINADPTTNDTPAKAFVLPYSGTVTVTNSLGHNIEKTWQDDEGTHTSDTVTINVYKADGTMISITDNTGEGRDTDIASVLDSIQNATSDPTSKAELISLLNTGESYEATLVKSVSLSTSNSWKASLGDLSPSVTSTRTYYTGAYNDASSNNCNYTIVETVGTAYFLAEDNITGYTPEWFQNGVLQTVRSLEISGQPTSVMEVLPTSYSKDIVVNNNNSYTLPNTGGEGILWMYYAGIALLLAGVPTYLLTRRRRCR